MLYFNLVYLQRKSKGQELLDKVCEHLNLLERDYFGLTYEDRHDPHNWLEMDKRIAKFVKSKFVVKLFFKARNKVSYLRCSLFIYIRLKVSEM